MAHEIDQGFAQRKWQAATCNRYRALLSCAYRIGVRNGKIAENPIPKMARRRESNNRIRFLDADEEAVLREDSGTAVGPRGRIRSSLT
jgi:hypothetical protein